MLIMFDENMNVRPVEKPRKLRDYPRPFEHSRFYTKDGWLTTYALACGYVEQKDYGPIRITLFRDGDCYHVRAYDHDQKIRCFWEVFRTLTEARRHYKYAEALLVAEAGRKLGKSMEQKA